MTLHHFKDPRPEMYVAVEYTPKWAIIELSSRDEWRIVATYAEHSEATNAFKRMYGSNMFLVPLNN